MRLTATDKAIGELNMRKANIEFAKGLIENKVDLGAALDDIDRCIELLRTVAPAPKPEKAARVAKTRKRKASGEVAE
jgi:hypothetical protein